MKCNICGLDTEIYGDKDKKAINMVVYENNIYCYCPRCIRKDLLTRLYAKLHPITNKGFNSKDLIELGEKQLREDKRFNDVV
jgi:hypothetical protein